MATDWEEELKLREECLKKLKELKIMYKDDLEILQVLDNINIGKAISAYKILTNKKVVKNINAKNLISILANDDNSYESICELVGKTYGKDAESILRERPQIKMRDIPNFDIFDKNIRDMIGYGGVHTFLTYYMDSERIITEIANNPELARYYKEFERITGEFFPPSAIGLEERLITFSEKKDLIKQIVDTGHSEDYAENLLLHLTDQKKLFLLKIKDRFINTRNNQKPTVFPEEDLKIENIEELKNYKERRDAILKTYLDEEKAHKYDVINFKYFAYMSSCLDDEDREKFLQDYLKFNQTNLTDEEVDLIELCSIFRRVGNNENFLDILDKLLSEQQNVITPVHMRKIESKIAENYKKEYLDSLMTVEKARQMSEKSEEILKKCSTSIEASENLEARKSRRYILKKDDDNMYFSDHLETSDGVKKFKDCIVTKPKRNKTIYTYQYKTKNGEDIFKKVLKIKQFDGKIFERIIYQMDDLAFRCFTNGEIDYEAGRNCPDGSEERFNEFLKTYQQKIQEAELVIQYNPEEKFKLEDGDVEGFLLYGVHSDKLCVTLMRYNNIPTSRYFNYGKFDRI